MPEQVSRAGQPITEASYTAPFSTPIYPMAGGLVLAKAVDALGPGEFSRLTNVYTYDDPSGRQLIGRVGQTSFATASQALVHSILRVELPQTASSTYAIGAGTEINFGSAGILGIVSTGYSGDPLTLLAHRPELSGDPWVFVGDSAKMAMIRATDGVEMPIGLPAPGIAAGLALAADNRTFIAEFSGATAAASWTPNAGFTYADPPVATPVPTQGDTGGPNGEPAVFFITATPGADVVPAGYFCFWGCPITANLDVVGSVPASDDDIIHFWIWFSHATQLAEIRLYVVVSESFSPSILPGADPTGAVNIDSYVKSISQNDLSTFIIAQQTQLNAAETTRIRQARETAVRGRQKTTPAPLRTETNIDEAKATARAKNRPLPQSRTNIASVDVSRSIQDQASPASATWKEIGAIGIPLRRGDFQRLGVTDGRNWGTVTGLVVMVRAAPDAGPVQLILSDWYLTGGAGPDSSDAANTPYDYRYTHYDPRTGTEGNPAPEQAASSALDTLRRGIVVTPASYGDAAIRQRFYRRGGTLPDDWYFVGENESDGGAITDTESDLAVVAAGTVEFDHYAAVPTVNNAGDTVEGQPCPVVFGPYNGQLFALGDPYRPGFVYACIPEEPGHWPPDLAHEVCSSSEELLNGVMFGGQPYVASRLRWFVLYPNLTGASGMTSQPTGATRGLAARWALTTGGGFIWFVSHDGVYRTTGGGQEKISGPVDPLFLGQAVNGYLPVNYANDTLLRCVYYENELWVQYADTANTVQFLIFQPITGSWRHYQFGTPTSGLFAAMGHDVSTLIMGAALTTDVLTHDGTTDLGAGIAGTIRTGSWDWDRPREEKIFGDQILDANFQGLSIDWTTYLNSETVVNPTIAVTAPAGRNRAIFDSFGTGPQQARNLAVDLQWTATGDAPIFYFLGTSLTAQPDLTVNRVTNWDDLGSPDEVYLTGVTFDCDTQGQDRTILIERDFGGSITTVATLTVNANGRHKLKFSWPAVQAHQVRVRPNDDCLAWLLYRADWIAEREPPRIALWDVAFENGWDQYHTGLDLYCDTGGATKQIVVQVDGVTLTDPATGLAYWEIATTGRQVVHLTLPWGRGHVYRFFAIDANPGLLYTHRWHLIEEPSEQANWNQPFTLFGTAADKWVKGVVLEVDTFGQDKTITLEADGAVVSTFTVNTSGRLVRQISLPNGQQLGRVWRLWPTDSLPSRLYSARPIFDEEPFALEEWITQQIDHGQLGFHYLIHAMITLKSTVDVTLEVTTYLNQTGASVVDTYVIPATGGQKLKRFVPFVARKGVLYQYHFLRAAGTPYWIYREESSVTLQPWDGGSPVVVKPFGNDDIDVPTRSMISAESAAQQPGGGST